MATITDEILIEALEENLADDPYGTAMYAIRNVLHRALQNDAMNDEEEEILVIIQRITHALDPSSGSLIETPRDPA